MSDPSKSWIEHLWYGERPPKPNGVTQSEITALKAEFAMCPKLYERYICGKWYDGPEYSSKAPNSDQ